MHHGVSTLMCSKTCLLGVARHCVGLPGLPTLWAQTRWFHQYRFMFSRFWRLEVREEGGSGVGLWGGHTSCLVDGSFLLLSSRDFSLMQAHVLGPPFHKRHLSFWITALPLWPHLTLIASLKALSPEMATQGARALYKVEEGYEFSP